MGWTVQGLNTGGEGIFRTSPDRSWVPLTLLYNGYRVSLPGVKWSERGVDQLPPSAEVKGRVELHFYSGTYWSFAG